MIETSLFEGKTIRLTAINLEEDPPVEAEFTKDLDYARLLRPWPVRPISPFELKKLHEERIKRRGEFEQDYYFAVRPKNEERFIGFIRIPHIGWSHSNGLMQMAIGDPAWKGQCELEALNLLLTYAFHELNLYRLNVLVPEYDQEGIHLFEQAGFTCEVRQREILYQADRYWDLLLYGILSDEWHRQQMEVKG